MGEGVNGHTPDAIEGLVNVHVFPVRNWRKPRAKFRDEFYRIRVKGHLGPEWSAWFDGLTITNELDDEAVLAGPVVDQAALHGVLAKIRNLGWPLIPTARVELNRDIDSHDSTCY